MALKLAFKVVITSTAIYWTNQLEVWSPLSQKQRVYDQVLANAQKLITENTPEALKFKLPNVVNSDLCATTNYYYNKGVLNSFEFLLNVPTTVGNLYGKSLEQLKALK